jgi:phospholipase/lecithinase/hemolysin
VIGASVGQAWAERPFDEIVIFGDSHSDTGNVFLLSQGLAVAPPYYAGRFSDGPVWVEQLAKRLKLDSPDPSVGGGTNYAFGGAQAGRGFSPTACARIDGTRTCVPNMGLQIELFTEAGGEFDGDELIVVQGGGNNLSPKLAANYIAEHVATLADAGGEFFLVPNLNRLSQDPGAVNGDQQLDNFVEDFNATLDQQLDALEATADITIVRMDWTALSDDMISAPAEKYGFTNVSDPACPGCFPTGSAPDAADTIVDNPDEYLYWDQFHFTRAAHTLIGDFAYEQVNLAFASSSGPPLQRPQAVAEPSTGLLALGAVLVFTIAARRR